MTTGCVYEWLPCENEFTGGRLELATVPLRHLVSRNGAVPGLNGRFVEVVNAGRSTAGIPDGAERPPSALGNARPDPAGAFTYQPRAGGGPVETAAPFRPLDPDAHASASHFGEVNVYHHATLIAERIDRLLAALGERPLPKVLALVNAHETAAGGDPTRWRPVDGAQYRFPARYQPGERIENPNRVGEMSFGPGFAWTREGWLPRIAGTAYRCDTSHIAGFIYREYGRHVARHIADFQADSMRAPRRQASSPTATDSAVADYWAASMLQTPYIWCWHYRHDPDYVFPYNLACPLTMADIGAAPTRGSRHDGIVLAAALWDLRRSVQPFGEDLCDLLVLSALTNIRRLLSDPYRPRVKATRSLRQEFSAFAACLVQADATRFDGKHRARITEALGRRGIDICDTTTDLLTAPTPIKLMARRDDPQALAHIGKITQAFPEVIIPTDTEFMHPDRLAEQLAAEGERRYDLTAMGDVMTGMRMRHRIRRYGPDYVFAWVKPIFRRSAIIAGNLEGPFSAKAEQAATTRNFSYKVNPKSASVLRRAGFNAMTLANNHLLDCGRGGVEETLATLAKQGIEVVGGGRNDQTAHDPAIFDTPGGRVGLLGYYWNRRTAATKTLAGSARDLPELVERDIGRLRSQVDRVAVMVHWGIPYDRQPSPEDRAKAHHFIDCGADIVIGCHPHLIQPMEIYRNRPIFYSVGNFAFGSGNSKGESLMISVRFLGDHMEVDIFPTYVQNRDPRLDYQPKILCGEAGRRTLDRLMSLSDDQGKLISAREWFGRVSIDLNEPAPMKRVGGRSRVHGN